MKIEISPGKIELRKTGGAVLLLFEDDKPGAIVSRVDRALGGTITRLLERGDFRPKPGAVRLLDPSGMAPERIALAGLGKRADCTPQRLRQAAGAAATALRATGAATISLCMDDLGMEAEETAQAAVEGSILGTYRYLRYKTGPGNNRGKDLRSLCLMTESAARLAALRRGARAGEAIAASVCLARDMVNTPSADMTPEVIAVQARAFGRRCGFRVRVLERSAMERLGMGALLGVAAGSAQPPRFIILEYRNGGRKPFVALVGKTITFDSGGISIKPSENMDKMKDDMAGGAAVLGAIGAAAALGLPLNIVGLLPATENMPGGSAYKPGDVLRTLSKQTIEIISTDAEGRLVLADALTYACRYRPAVIVDIATLTGACRVALGQEAVGMLGTSRRFTEMLREAGEKTGERVWELPLWEAYHDLIKSDIADMKNTGGRDGGVITAACLLSRFVQEHPWVHLDIAATAWTEKERPYTPKGATGIGARLLTQFLRDYGKTGAAGA